MGKPESAEAAVTKPDDKLKASGGGVKKKSASGPKGKRKKTAFFVFMDEFRKEYKEKHPANKSVAEVSKAGGEKWRSLSDAEKAQYHEVAGGNRHPKANPAASTQKESTDGAEDSKPEEEGTAEEKEEKEEKEEQEEKKEGEEAAAVDN